MAYERLQCEHAGQCSKCSAKHTPPMWIFFDKSAERGKKALCVDCGFAERMTAAQKAQQQPQTAKPSPVAEPMVSPAVAEPKPQPAMDLASIIAAAVAPMVQGRLDEARVLELIAENTKPPAHTITVQHVDGTKVDCGRQHKQFEELLMICNARTAKGRLNVWITGSAGTGKTTAAENVAKALNLRFAVYPTMTESYKFFGHITPGTGEYHRTIGRDIWEFGGMIILDDFDGTPAEVAIELNAPFANGSCTFPDGRVVDRHADCVIILTANTWGTGATNEFVGRMKQDAAFLDRFVMLDWQIDEDLESDTCPVVEWAHRVQQVRRNVAAKGLKVLVTPRASYYGASLLLMGMKQERVEAVTLRKFMTAEQWRSVC